MSKQMLELADRLAGSLQPFDFLTRDERDLIIAALRCSAVSDSDGEHELIDRLLAYADNCSADGMAQAESDLRAACDCIIGGKSAINRLKAQVRTEPQKARND